MKIAFYTLGCKVNQYETQALEQVLTGRGHTLVPFDGEADAYIINTCTVTAVSDKKSRQMIRRARKAAPDAVIAVCGCYPQTHPDAMDGLGVDLVSGTGDRLGFAGLLERTWQERQPVTALDNAFDRRSFEILPAGGLEGRTRAMLKIEDGCVNFCSYCIIPYARGRVRSLSPRTPGGSWSGCWRRGIGRSSSPALRSPPGDRTCQGSRPLSTCWKPSAGTCPERSASAWAAWSPAPSPLTSAAGRPPCPICAPTSICPCSPAVTPFWPG